MSVETLNHNESMHFQPKSAEIITELTPAELLLQAIERGHNPASEITELIGHANTEGSFEDRVEVDTMAGLFLTEAENLGTVPEELGKQPVPELQAAFQNILDLRGPDSVEDIISTIEEFEQQHEVSGKVEYVPEAGSSYEAIKTEDALWNKIAMKSTEIKPYKDNNTLNPKLGRIPTSLPMRSNSEYDPNAIKYASGDEMKDVLQMYGVDKESIDAATSEDGKIDIAVLPPELQHTLLTAQLYEAIGMSHDPEMKRQATERNADVTVEDIWQPSTLHHVMDATHLGSVLQDGQLGVMLDKDDDKLVNNGSMNEWNVNFGVPKGEINPEASHSEKINNLTYNNRGDVYIHYARPEGCYREGEEYWNDSAVTLMSGGLPSTEISALTIRERGGTSREESYMKTHDAVVEAGFYIPIFDLDGNVIYSNEDFQKDMELKANGTYQSMGEKVQIAQKEAQESAYKQYREELETAAAEKNMSVDEYQAWKSAQPIVRPPM